MKQSRTRVSTDQVTEEVSAPARTSVRLAPYRVSISRYALRKFREQQAMRVLQHVMNKYGRALENPQPWHE